jgi:hypothetical protein
MNRRDVPSLSMITALERGATGAGGKVSRIGFLGTSSGTLAPSRSLLA